MIYTLIESSKRQGHEPYAYLKELLERLPGMHLSEIDTSLPVNWRPPPQPTRRTSRFVKA